MTSVRVAPAETRWTRAGRGCERGRAAAERTRASRVPAPGRRRRGGAGLWARWIIERSTSVAPARDPIGFGSGPGARCISHRSPGTRWRRRTNAATPILCRGGKSLTGGKILGVKAHRSSESHSPEGLYLLGEAYRRVGKLGKARETFERAIQVYQNPDGMGGFAARMEAVGLGGHKPVLCESVPKPGTSDSAQ